MTLFETSVHRLVQSPWGRYGSSVEVGVHEWMDFTERLITATAIRS